MEISPLGWKTAYTGMCGSSWSRDEFNDHIIPGVEQCNDSAWESKLTRGVSWTEQREYFDLGFLKEASQRGTGVWHP